MTPGKQQAQPQPLPQPLTMRQRLRYHVDNSLTRGVFTIILWTGLLLFAVVIVVAGMVWLTGAGPSDRPVPFPEAIWLTLTRSLDAGTVGPDQGAHFRIAGIVITVVGLLAVALVIGLVTSAVERRVAVIRGGRSMVAEKGHVLILGYSEKLAIVVNEVLLATAEPDPHAVVVLTQKDTTEVEDTIRRARQLLDPAAGRRARRQWKRVVVRRGQPSSVPDLRRVRPHDAIAVIVLRPELAGDDADAAAVQATLAVVKARQCHPPVPIVTEIVDERTAKALRAACPAEVIPVPANRIVAQVAAQTSRAAGLGAVYEELLNFEGVEFYLHDPGESATGMTFADALLASKSCAVVGIHHADGVSELCPDFTTTLATGDRVILLAEDDSVISFDPSVRDLLGVSAVSAPLDVPEVQRTLIVGWNRVAPQMAAEIDRQVARGSELHVLTDPTISESLDSYPVHVVNQELFDHHDSAIDQPTIERILSATDFDHIVVLCSHQNISPLYSDARTLLTLLHIRGVLDAQVGRTEKTNVVTEVMESHSKDIAQVAQPDDFIVSQRLVSLLLAQLAMTPELDPVFVDIFDAEGSRISLEPPAKFAIDSSPHTFEDLIRQTAQRGAVLLGWQAASDRSPHRITGLRLNPHKSDTVTLVESDRLVVLARN